jgi:predicted SAM-dependent methyltransferase
MEKTEIAWSKLFTFRDAIHARYREIWDVPLVKKRLPLLKSFLREGMTLLDAGAGMKGMKRDIEGLGLKIRYKSMDVDRTNEHDFYDLSDISETFDAILLFEVIEHLPVEEGLDLLSKLCSITKSGGIIIVSTPNVFNPSRYMRDATHRTPYAYDELAGLMGLAGYDVAALSRSYNDAFHRYVAKRYLFSFLFRFLSIDYAYTIFAVGRKPGGTATPATGG